MPLLRSARQPSSLKTMSILIKNGRIITAAEDYVAEIYIEGETVSAIGTSLGVEAERVVDATGRYVLPGCIDPHSHIAVPAPETWGGGGALDDFTSGTISAACGGITTVVDFCLQWPGQSLREALDTWHGKIEQAPPVIDVGFHIAVTDVRESGSLDELESLVEEGITSFKFFMCYKGAYMVDDETLFSSMQVAERSGALIMVHAENGDSIDLLMRQAVAAGNVSPIWHARTRPPETEAEATNRAIQLAHVAGAPLYVVHVSCRPAAEAIARARAEGWEVWGETCDTYLVIDESALERPDGAKFIYTPPPRTPDHVEHLWGALARDELSVIGSDHVSWGFERHKDGKEDFTQVPNGAPGNENVLHLVHDRGVRQGRISLNRMVELMAANPAKALGLYPKKGTIAAGSDADIVIFDPEREHVLSVETHHMPSDYNLYEGTRVVGAPELVIARGQVVVEDNRFVGKPGAGAFIERARYGEKLLNPTPARA